MDSFHPDIVNPIPCLISIIFGGKGSHRKKNSLPYYKPRNKKGHRDNSAQCYNAIMDCSVYAGDYLHHLAEEADRPS